MLAAALMMAAVPQDMAIPEPVPMFQSVCIGGSARLSRKVMRAITYAELPAPAKRALGASTASDRMSAERSSAPAAVAVPNAIYQLAGNPIYLFVPGTSDVRTPFSESCGIVWHAASDEDYPTARKLLLPEEDRIPLTARPSASPVGAAVTTSAGETNLLTAAAFAGWVVLRSSPLSSATQAPGAQ
jgi:hypothetical protein